MKNISYKKKQGFTLVEILLVLAILAVLAVVVIPKFTGRSKQAKITAAKTDIATLKSQIEIFETDNAIYPNSLQDLITQPTDTPDWQGPYVEQIRNDPWGNSYIYQSPGKNNENSFDLSSMGPDGKQGGGDDITNWASE